MIETFPEYAIRLFCINGSKWASVQIGGASNSVISKQTYRSVLMAAGRCHASSRSRSSVYSADRDSEHGFYHQPRHHRKHGKDNFKKKDKTLISSREMDITLIGGRKFETARGKEEINQKITLIRNREMENALFRDRDIENTSAKGRRHQENIPMRDMEREMAWAKDMERVKCCKYVENDGVHSSSQSNSGNSNVQRHFAKDVDKELGELSSRSPSGDSYFADDHDFDSCTVESGETQKSHHLNSISKKRKYSRSPVPGYSRGQQRKVLSAEYLKIRIQEHSPLSVENGELGPHPESFNFEGEEKTLLPRGVAASRWADSENSPEDSSFLKSEEKRRKPLSSADSRRRGLSCEQIGGTTMSPEPREFIKKRLDGSQSSSVSSETNVCQGSGKSSSGGIDHHFRVVEPCGEANQKEILDFDEEDDSKDDSYEQQPELGSYGSSPPVTPMSLHTSLLPVPRRIDMLQSCRSVDEFERLNKINEGTYGVVYRARNRKSGEIVALKKVKMEREREGFPMTSLREINVLLSFHHPAVVNVKEVVVGSNLDSIFMVMEYMEHDLKGFMETMKQPFSQSEVKCLMLQLLEGVNYLHDNWVLHRDLKTSNLLLNNKGELKICDFGLARQYGSPLKTYTHLVVTLWYRAPELLLGAKHYSTTVDMWSLGCIMAEILAKEPLFNGKTEIDQIDKCLSMACVIRKGCYKSVVNSWLIAEQAVFHCCQSMRYNKLRDKFPVTSFSGRPILSESGFDLLNRLLTYDPNKRITAEEALKHEWFREVPLPKSKEFMPTYPAQNDHDSEYYWRNPSTIRQPLVIAMYMDMASDGIFKPIFKEQYRVEKILMKCTMQALQIFFWWGVFTSSFWCKRAPGEKWRSSSLLFITERIQGRDLHESYWWQPATGMQGWGFWNYLCIGNFGYN
eukprot:Gb_15107 [translate_table: standard]